MIKIDMYNNLTRWLFDKYYPDGLFRDNCGWVNSDTWTEKEWKCRWKFTTDMQDTFI